MLKYRQFLKFADVKTFTFELCFKMSKISFLLAMCLLAAASSACSVEAIYFDCRFTTYSLGVIGSRYACNATVINSSSAYLESVTGGHQTGKNNEIKTIVQKLNQVVILVQV